MWILNYVFGNNYCMICDALYGFGYQSVAKTVARLLKPYLFKQVLILDRYLQLPHDVKAEPVDLVIRLDYFPRKLDVIFLECKERVAVHRLGYQQHSLESRV